jgi:UDP-glucose 4-epimerase
VDAFVRAAGRGADGARLNIGSGMETTVMDLHRLVAEAAACDATPHVLPARAGELQRVCLDVTAARRSLGWEPRVDIRSGIGDTVDWLRDCLVPAARS